MKLAIFFFALFGIIFCKEQKVGVTTSTLSTMKTHSQGDVIGEAYNSDDHQDVVAVTYGIASDGGNNLNDINGYKVPQIVEKLPDVIKPPTPGPLESIDEVPSETTYYDGSLNLNVAQVDCHVLSVANECFKQTVCGWCGQTSSCVRGTALSPIEPCTSGYAFAGFNNGIASSLNVQSNLQSVVNAAVTH